MAWIGRWGRTSPSCVIAQHKNNNNDIYIYIYVYTYDFLVAYIYIYIYLSLFLPIYIYLYFLFIYVYIYIYMYIYIIIIIPFWLKLDRCAAYFQRAHARTRVRGGVGRCRWRCTYSESVGRHDNRSDGPCMKP